MGGVCSRGWGGGVSAPGVPGPGGVPGPRGCLLQGEGVPGLGGAWSWRVCLVPGRCLPQGVPGLGGLVSQHALRQTPPPRERRLLLRTVRILLECILVFSFIQWGSLVAERSLSTKFCGLKCSRGYFQLCDTVKWLVPIQWNVKLIKEGFPSQHTQDAFRHFASFCRVWVLSILWWSGLSCLVHKNWVKNCDSTIYSTCKC